MHSWYLCINVNWLLHMWLYLRICAFGHCTYFSAQARRKRNNNRRGGSSRTQSRTYRHTEKQNRLPNRRKQLARVLWHLARFFSLVLPQTWRMDNIESRSGTKPWPAILCCFSCSPNEPNLTREGAQRRSPPAKEGTFPKAPFKVARKPHLMGLDIIIAAFVAFFRPMNNYSVFEYQKKKSLCQGHTLCFRMKWVSVEKPSPKDEQIIYFPFGLELIKCRIVNTN